jgi:uncharacterized protein
MYERFHLVLMVNHACNLRCTYCYTGAKFSKPMSEATGRVSIDRSLRSINAGGTLELGFFGGEPLLEADLINSLIEYATRLAVARHIQIVPGLTTNGTVNTDSAWAVMRREDVQLAISHDGLPPVHDRHRLTILGRASSGAVEKTLLRLLALGKDFCAIMVVRPDNVDSLPDGIAHLRQLGVRHIEPSLDLWAHWTQQDIHRLEQVVVRCAQLWREGLPVHSIGWFDEKAAELLRAPIDASARCAFGAGQIAVSPAGNLYPCERLIGEDGVDNLARLNGRADDGEDFLSFLPAPPRAHSECGACEMRDWCNTTCRCGNLIRTGDAQTPDELLCLWNQACLTATAEALAALSPR